MGAGGSPLGAASAPAAGPSDYTMLIRQSATPAPPAAQAPAQGSAAPAAKPKRSVPLGLIIALNIVLVLAIALVLYFVFRPSPPNAESGGPLPTSVKAPTGAVPKVTAPTVTPPTVSAPTLPKR